MLDYAHKVRIRRRDNPDKDVQRMNEPVDGW